MKETAVVHPSDTCMFGEKKNEPTPAMDYFMDLNEGVGNDMDKVEQGCHGVASKARNCRRLQLRVCGRQRALHAVWEHGLAAQSLGRERHQPARLRLEALAVPSQPDQRGLPPSLESGSPPRYQPQLPPRPS